MKRLKSLVVPWTLTALLLAYSGWVSGQETSEPLEAEETPEAEIEVETSPETAKIDLEGASFQEFLDQLFGTPETDGLLSGEGPFVLHGKDIMLTPEEAQNFFAPASPSEMDFASLVAAFEELKGGNIKIEGFVDGSPFQFMIAGRQLKLEGISLTQAEFDALVAELQDLPGLHEAKIEATVDGELVSVNMQNVPGRVRVQFGDLTSDDEELEASRTENRGRRNEQAENTEAATNRPERVDVPERPNRTERIERLERIERPDFERPGRGRN